MEITRRDFLRYVGASAAALGLTATQVARIETALATAEDPPVLWLSGSACTGCSVSLLNVVNPTVDQVLLDTISLKYHTTLMAAGGDLAVKAATSTRDAGGYVLVVEGAIPTASGGKYCYVWDEAGRPVTMAEAVTALAAKATHVIAVGTCAAFGGIPSRYSAAAAQGLKSFLGRSVINLPGCPAHPDWIVGTITSVLAGAIPALDGNSRPTTYYARSIHDTCPRKGQDEAKTFGQHGLCLKALGCKGSETRADCVSRQWNNKQSWCIAVDGPCIGCTEPKFPSFPLHRR